jgi:two-component system cell cycle response regulator
MPNDTRRILIVEDNLLNVKMLEAKLRSRRFEVDVALDGREALEKFPQGRFDGVLLDVMLPEIDGFEVCRRLKTHPMAQGVAVVMITALDRPNDREAGFDAGADEFFVKPVEDEVLFRRLEQLVRAPRPAAGAGGAAAGAT